MYRPFMYAFSNISKEQIARDFLEADVYKDPRGVLTDILTISTAMDSCS